MPLKGYAHKSHGHRIESTGAEETFNINSKTINFSQPSSKGGTNIAGVSPSRWQQHHLQLTTVTADDAAAVVTATITDRYSLYCS